MYKKDDVHQLENYRPISLLPAISKIFERVVYKQLYQYFDSNNYFYSSQYGFRKGHSTEHAVLEVTDKIMAEIDRGNTPLTVFLDPSKAFDTLDHQILSEKLEFFGLTGMASNWVHSYLSERQQYVEINSCKSDTYQITTGVPQGSIWGPLLYLILHE